MQEIGIDISTHTPKNVKQYFDQEWDYVITVCGNTNNEKIYGAISSKICYLCIGLGNKLNKHRISEVNSTEKRRNCPY